MCCNGHLFSKVGLYTGDVCVYMNVFAERKRKRERDMEGGMEGETERARGREPHREK